LAVAEFTYKRIVLTVISVGIAAITGLSSFFRWERTWRGNKTAQVTIEQLCAKWELEVALAKVMDDHEEKMRHAYLATSDLLTNVRSVTSSESEAFFNSVQFPQSDGKKTN
jgi:hypothetical protein